MSRYPALLSPASIGPVPVRNRVVSSSHQTSLVHNHLPTDDLVAYHRSRGHGGVGAIFIEATAVHPTGLLTAHTMGGYLPAIVPGYRRLSDAVHAEGARLFVQLFHGGRELIASAPKPSAVAPSAVPSLRPVTPRKAAWMGSRCLWRTATFPPSSCRRLAIAAPMGTASSPGRGLRSR
jgi:2,4-dienoyl-CoA reductase-like NADH-dependent reductase (Old Yellow Enzyme family)